MTKPNKDGWIRHRGGKCPVDADAMVEVRLRDGTEHTGDDAENGGYWAWHHFGCDGDIMAWRPHKADRTDQQDAIERFNEQTARMPISCGNVSKEGPIQWRDRIREIDAASKEEEARHCDAMAAYDEERTSLVAKLKSEGFALIQSDELDRDEESAQQDIAQQDMSDPANWRVGDLFEIIGRDSHGFPMGELVKLIVFENDHDEEDGHRYAYLDDSDYWWVRDCNVRWHSRPTN